MQDVTAFILAGGQSSRMGTEKAFLELEGQLLIDRMIGIAKTVSEQLRIVGPKQKFAAFGQIALDIYPDRGPLGGIHAALNISRTEFNLMLAVDMPFIEPHFLEYLLKQAVHSEALVTVPQVGGGFQPLCACYRKEFEEVAEKALAAGHNKIDSLFAPAITRVIDEPEFAKLGLPATMFRNLNTQEDFARAKGLGLGASEGKLGEGKLGGR
jgi:molybdopterin-guanine dinucleotide biosynthesis protein A